MAFSAADLTAIDQAIVKLMAGERVTEIRFTDRLVKYQEVTVAELRALRGQIAGQLGPQHVPFAGRTWNAVESGKGL